jgi:hypothetical protein
LGSSGNAVIRRRQAVRFLSSPRLFRCSTIALIVLRELESIAATTRGEVRARALPEIGLIQRVSNAFAQAASTYVQAAEVAATLGQIEIVVDAWIGLACVHNLARDHGAVADALQRAAAGSQFPF